MEPAGWLYGSGGRLRAGWRVGVFLCVYFLANGILEGAATPVLTYVSIRSGNFLSPHELVDMLSALAAIAVVLHQIDHQGWSDVGLQRSAWRTGGLAKGAALGSAAILGTSGTLVAFGWLHFAPSALDALLNGAATGEAPLGAWAASSVRITLLLLPAALFEELIFRGYLWRVAADAGGPRVALFVTSVLFGLAHLQNPAVSALAITNVMLAGVALGLVRMHTNSLPAAWMAHFAWNWVMACALHVEVSGLPVATPGYQAVLSGPAWFTGGHWGPEGGAAASFVLLAAIAFGMNPTMFRTPHSNLPGSASASGAAEARST